MWKFIKHNAGGKLHVEGCVPLWFGIDKSIAETRLSKKVAAGVAAVRKHVVDRTLLGEAESKKCVKGDYSKGLVWIERVPLQLLSSSATVVMLMVT